MEARLVPCAGVEDIGERVGGAPDLLIPVVKRGEAEADEVGRAEIADHAAIDQRLHDRIALGMGEHDVAAASRGVARAGEG